MCDMIECRSMVDDRLTRIFLNAISFSNAASSYVKYVLNPLPFGYRYLNRTIHVLLNLSQPSLFRLVCISRLNPHLIILIPLPFGYHHLNRTTHALLNLYDSSLIRLVWVVEICLFAYANLSLFLCLATTTIGIAHPRPSWSSKFGVSFRWRF
jgi:hypothetical protein